VGVEHAPQLGLRQLINGARLVAAARVVDHDVDATPALVGIGDDRPRAGGVRNALEVGRGDTPRRLDLGDHLVGRCRIGARHVGRATHVVHQHLRAPARQQPRVLASQPSPRTGDDRDAVVESQLGHAPPSRHGP
jgi:hypothetical protein